MYKIHEVKDISKQILDVKIDSPIFTSLLQDIDKKIQQCLFELHNENFESGELSIKLGIDLRDAYFQYNKKDDLSGETMRESYAYKRPVFEHKVTLTLKKTSKAEGMFNAERELQLIDGKFIAVPITDPQVNVFDLLEQREEAANE